LTYLFLHSTWFMVFVQSGKHFFIMSILYEWRNCSVSFSHTVPDVITPVPIIYIALLAYGGWHDCCSSSGIWILINDHLYEVCVHCTCPILGKSYRECIEYQSYHLLKNLLKGYEDSACKPYFLLIIEV